MAARKRRPIAHPNGYIEAARTFQRSLSEVSAKVPPSHPQGIAARELTEALHRYADALAGRKDVLYARGHSSAPFFEGKDG